MILYLFMAYTLAYPLLLTAVEIFLLLFACRRERVYQRCRFFDVVAVLLGVLYNVLYLSELQDVKMLKDWQEQLANQERHAPVYTAALPTVLVIAAVGFAGYLLVNFIPLGKIPPLVLVIGMAAMYLGTIESVIWGIQVYDGDIFLLLLPVNCVIITARTVIYKAVSYTHLDVYKRQQWGGEDFASGGDVVSIRRNGPLGQGFGREYRVRL